MPDNDWALAQGTVDFRNQEIIEQHHAIGEDGPPSSELGERLDVLEADGQYDEAEELADRAADAADRSRDRILAEEDFSL